MTYITGDRKNPKGFTLFETVVVLAIFSIALILIITIFSNASTSQRREAVSQKALQDARQVFNALEQDIQTKRIDYNFYKGRDTYVDALNNEYRVDCSTFPNDECDLRQPVQVLALVGDNGEKIRYWFDESTETLKICKSNPSVDARVCGIMDVSIPADGTTDEEYVDITPKSVAITRVNFYITPATDPGFRGQSVPCSFDAACACIKENNVLGEQLASDPAGCSEWTSGYCDVTCQLANAQPTVTTAMQITGEGLSVGEISIPVQFTTTSRVYDR